MKRTLLLVLLFGLLLAINVASTLAQEVTPTPASSVWNQIPVDGAVCSRGTPYSFFVHPGDPARLVVYFQGGGACYDAATCQAGGVYITRVNTTDLDHASGIFDLANPQNTLAGDTIVYLPYCTADLFTGSVDQTFTNGTKTSTIHFHGFTNAAAVFDWVYANYPQPGRLIITGSSAGAYGAIFNAPYLLDHYPRARAIVLGDAGVGVAIGEQPQDIFSLTPWGMQQNIFQGHGYTIPPNADLSTVLYAAAAEAFPRAEFAEYSSSYDSVQSAFSLLQGGTSEDWNTGMKHAFDQLSNLPNFHSYIAWGSDHTILNKPLFYQMQVNGKSFRDWFTTLVNAIGFYDPVARAYMGKPITDVACTDCRKHEIVTVQ